MVAKYRVMKNLSERFDFAWLYAKMPIMDHLRNALDAIIISFLMISSGPSEIGSVTLTFTESLPEMK